LERLWVRLQHGVERRVDQLDPLEVGLSQPAGGERARRHRGLELLDRRLLELEHRVAGHGRTLSQRRRGQRTATMRQGPANAGDVCRKHGRPVAPTLETVGRFLVRRLLFTVFVLFVVSLITFVIFVKLPASDPARRAAGKATTEANIEAAREAFGLNRPVYVQYARFAQGLVPWPGLFLNEDVYYSYSNFVPVKEEIFARLPVSVALA